MLTSETEYALLWAKGMTSCTVHRRPSGSPFYPLY